MWLNGCLKKEETENETPKPYPPSPEHTVAQGIYKKKKHTLQKKKKKKKSLASQTALECNNCDCENDWDLINSPPRLM